MTERKQDDGGVKQPTRNESLRQPALRARRDIREAKKFRKWQENGWQLDEWQVAQVVLLEIGTLDQQMRAANESYGHGVGAEIGLSREQAATLAIFSDAPLKKGFAA